MKAKAVRTTEQRLKQQKADAERNLVTVKKAAGGALVADNDNPFITVGAELDKILGAPLAKFSKTGEFSIGDVDVIPGGTRCRAHADEMTLDWDWWNDGRPDPAKRKSGRVADGFVPPQRKDLGDTDETLWEKDDDGKPRDPWQFSMSVPITRLDAGGETYKFVTGSKGGLRCLGGLMRAYGRRVRDEKVPGLPIVELAADHYKHRQYGKIFIPVMRIVGWTGADGKPLSVADDLNDEIGF